MTTAARRQISTAISAGFVRRGLTIPNCISAPWQERAPSLLPTWSTRGGYAAFRSSSSSSSNIYNKTGQSFKQDAEPPSNGDIVSKASSSLSESVGVDAFNVSNVFVSGIPLFSGSGMVIVRVQPASFEVDSNRLVCTGSGLLRLSFYPRHDQETNRFDTSRKFNFGVRGIDVGSILETDPVKLSKVPVIVPGIGGILEIGPSSSGAVGLVVLRGVPTKKQEVQPEAVEVEISSGQFKTLQTVLNHVAPSLFGWQVLIDPKLASCFVPNHDWTSKRRPSPTAAPDEATTSGFFSQSD